MKMTGKILFIFLSLLIFHSYSEKKVPPNLVYTNDNVGKFLTLPYDAPAVLKKITNAITKQENKKPFLDGIIKEHGYANWKYCDIRYREDSGDTRFVSGDTLVTIPFLIDSVRSVNAILICFVRDTSIKFTLMKGKDYHKYGFSSGLDRFSASFAALQLMHFDHKMFGDSIFAVVDARLFNNTDQVIHRKRLLKYRESTYFPASANIGMNWDKKICQKIINEGNQGRVIKGTPGYSFNYHYSEITCTSIMTIIEISGGFGAGDANHLKVRQGEDNGSWHTPVCSTCIPTEDIFPCTFPIMPVYIKDLYDPNKPFENPDMPVNVADDSVSYNGFQINDVPENDTLRL